jgi:hypothetical protein
MRNDPNEPSAIRELRNPPGPPLWTRAPDARQPLALWLFIAHPALVALHPVVALQAQGWNALLVPSLAVARQLLAGQRQRVVAVLDTSRAASYPVREVYELLHSDPPVPTLVLQDPAELAMVGEETTLSASDMIVPIPDSLQALVASIDQLLARERLRRAIHGTASED